MKSLLNQSSIIMFSIVGLLVTFASGVRASNLPPATKPSPPKVIQVAIYEDAGSPEISTVAAENALKISPSFHCKRVTAQDIRDGALAGMDVFLQPGGSGSAQAKKLQETGKENIRSFVKAGGGYVGICAGSYLATSYYKWSLHILNADVVDHEHWARGFGTVQLKFSPLGQAMLDQSKDTIDCAYHQGPLLAPGHDKDLPPYEPIATFATEIAKNGAPKGVMIGTTAMARGIFGKGHVIAISPHPEKTDGLDNIVRRAVEWSATGEVGHIHPPTTRPITLAEANESVKASIKTPTTSP